MALFKDDSGIKDGTDADDGLVLVTFVVFECPASLLLFLSSFI